MHQNLVTLHSLVRFVAFFQWLGTFDVISCVPAMQASLVGSGKIWSCLCGSFSGKVYVMDEAVVLSQARYMLWMRQDSSSVLYFFH
jgi:hypothetical protein